MKNLFAVFASSMLAFCLFMCSCDSGNGVPPDCGNNIMGTGEECDGEDFGGNSCRALGYYSGFLGCTGECKLSTSNCTGECGDDIINGSEECDGTQLGGRLCVDLGYDGGDLVCGDGCQFDASGCTGQTPCGNGDIDQNEECDPPGEIESETCTEGGRRLRICDIGCQWGDWSNCVIEGECEPDKTEDELCGNCGTRSRTCGSDGQWGAWSSCEGEGECSAGATQNEDCGNCGEKSRECNQDCQWGDWGSCQGEGVCSPGAIENQDCGNGGYQTRTCEADCQWGDLGICQDEGDCTPNDTQDLACGNCGTQSRTCDDNNQWEPWSACTGEGDCATGASQSRDCGNCGTQERTCSASCQWEQWGTCTGEGVCAAGQTEEENCTPCGTRTRTCLASCEWGGWTFCPPCDEIIVWSSACWPGPGVGDCLFNHFPTYINGYLEHTVPGDYETGQPLCHFSLNPANSDCHCGYLIYDGPNTRFRAYWIDCNDPGTLIDSGWVGFNPATLPIGRPGAEAPSVYAAAPEAIDDCGDYHDWDWCGLTVTAYYEE